ncbi:hypothetical protein M422DRAFT_55993 [Sphaerobolus stellatus SS14]|uniref:Uncharacterized protein n=1 Tax=Sphaerobolus stellatus (strain SS14) TaxID=990650 RepID=A0A0C9UJ36_SPHS4|nr:hypothetical protein M422DRAFT_55993 [Sphaerobolus stellatus SS14]
MCRRHIETLPQDTEVDLVFDHGWYRDVPELALDGSPVDNHPARRLPICCYTNPPRNVKKNLSVIIANLEIILPRVTRLILIPSHRYTTKLLDFLLDQHNVPQPSKLRLCYIDISSFEWDFVQRTIKESFQTKLMRNNLFANHAPQLADVYWYGYWPPEAYRLGTALRALSVTSASITPNMSLEAFISILSSHPTLVEIVLEDALEYDMDIANQMPFQPIILPRLKVFKIMTSSQSTMIPVLRSIVISNVAQFHYQTRKVCMTEANLANFCLSRAVSEILPKIVSVYVDFEAKGETFILEGSSSECPHHGELKILLSFRPELLRWASPFWLCFPLLRLVAVGPLGRYFLSNPSAINIPFLNLYSFIRRSTSSENFLPSNGKASILSILYRPLSRSSIPLQSPLVPFQLSAPARSYGKQINSLVEALNDFNGQAEDPVEILPHSFSAIEQSQVNDDGVSVY